MMSDHRYLNLNQIAWRQIRQTWRIKRTPMLLWQTWISGTLVAATDRLQTIAIKKERDACDLAGCVFIMGYWRSGTTFLHELLSQDKRYFYPTTSACINPHHFAITGAGSSNGVKTRTRPMDNMLVRLDTPQEDEFALLSLGARSPYEALLAPSHLRGALALGDPDDLCQPESDNWKTIFLNFLKTVSLVGERRPLIIKSPTHGYRVSTIRRLLPDAKFILIVRHPHTVFESAANMWKMLMGMYGLEGGISDQEIRETICDDRLRFERKLQSGLEGIAPDQLVQIRYEELIENPIAIMRNVYNKLSLGEFEQVRVAMEKFLEQRASFVPRNVSPTSNWRQRLDIAWSEIMQFYGYQ